VKEGDVEASTTVEQDEVDGPDREVEIVVNNRPVQVHRRTTGSAIKSAAGVPADYQLFEIRGHEEIEIGNDEIIEVHHGERFAATPPIEPA
jgi:hypothetical protein